MMNALLSLLKNKMTAAVLLLFVGGATAFAQVTYTDSVCAGEQDVVYGISGAAASSSYSWSLSDPTAGTIDNSVSANNSTIEIDWSTMVGTYTLRAIEMTANGCYGDTVTLDVVINPLPTATLVGDSICEDFSGTLTFNLTGTAPWTINYTDGTNNFTATATSSPYVVTTPTYTTNQTITVTSVTDGSGCAADPSTLPTAQIYVYPKPTTGPIYHY